MNNFRCKKCGSSKLVFEKYVHCKTPIEIHEDGTIVYLKSIIDEDDVIATGEGFCCADCDHAIVFKAGLVESEADLREMLSLSEAERERINQEYLDREMEYAEYRRRKDEEFSEAIFLDLQKK